MFVKIAIFGLLLALGIARLFRPPATPAASQELKVDKVIKPVAKPNPAAPTLRQRSKKRIMDAERLRTLERRGIDPTEPGI